MDLPGSKMWTLWFLCLFLTFRPGSTKFIKFKPLYEYEYNFKSDSDVKDLGKFTVDAKVRPNINYKLIIFIHTYIVNFQKTLPDSTLSYIRGESTNFINIDCYGYSSLITNISLVI